MSKIIVDNIKTPSATASFGFSGFSKAYLQYDQVAASITGSYNISSVSDDTTGEYSVNLTNAMTDATYSSPVSAGSESGDSQISFAGICLTRGAITSSFFGAQVGDTNDGNKDVSTNMASVYGDLA